MTTIVLRRRYDRSTHSLQSHYAVVTILLRIHYDRSAEKLQFTTATQRYFTLQGVPFFDSYRMITFVCKSMRVCICVYAPEAINN